MRKQLVNIVHTVETLTSAVLYIAADVLVHRHHA